MKLNFYNNKLHKIALNSALLSKQLFAGNFTSIFSGSSLNFKELRDYQIDDDIKSITWTSSARFGKPLVKINEEFRQQHIIFLVDVSKSVEFSTAIKTKKDLIAEICFLIAYSSHKNNDKIAAVFFSDKIEKVIPLSNNENNILLITKNLTDFQATSRGTNYSNVLKYLDLTFRKDAIVFLISDFVTELNYEKELSLAAKKFKLMVIKVFDAVEMQTLPNIGLIKILDEESEKIGIFNAKKLNKNKENWQKKQEYFEYFFKKNNIKSINIEINDNYISKLKEFFDKYRKK